MFAPSTERYRDRPETQTKKKKEKALALGSLIWMELFTVVELSTKTARLTRDVQTFVFFFC